MDRTEADGALRAADAAKIATPTGYECTAYFNGGDGLGTCDTVCQWWFGSCPKAKGSPAWDGQDERHESQILATAKHRQRASASEPEPKAKPAKSENVATRGA